MTKYDSLIGCKFHKLRLLEVTNEMTSGSRYGMFKCECGNIKKILIRNVIREKSPTLSCGCVLLKNVDTRTDKDLIKKYKSTYRSWSAMTNRANGKYNHPTNHKYYSNVNVCSEWRKFENFLKDMGVRPEGTTLDRIDSRKDYTPDNCRWSNLRTQQNNRKCTISITAFGETLPATEFAEKYNINYNTVKWYYYNNRDIEQFILRRN